MKLSLELLTAQLFKNERISNSNVQVFAPHNFDFSNRKVSGVKILSQPEPELSEDMLWFGSADTLKQIPKETLHDRCFVLGGTMEDISTLNCEDSVYILMQSLEITFMSFNILLDYFKALEKWDTEASLIIARKRPLQEILELSESIINNPIYVWNGDFTIIGKPSYPVRELPALEKWCELGHVPGEAVAQFVHEGYFSNHNEYRIMKYVDIPSVSNYPRMLKVFFEGSRQCLVMLQYFLYVSNSPVQIELLHLVENKIEQYAVEVLSTGNSNRNHFYEPFIRDLINGTLSKQEIVDKLNYINLSYEAAYRIYAISFERYTAPLVSYVKRSVKAIKPSVHAVEMNHVLFILSHDKENEINSDLCQTERFSEVLINAKCGCGISRTLGYLSMIAMASKQALAAVHMGELLSPEDVIRSYADYYFYDMLYNYRLAAGRSFEGIINPGLIRLMENDRKDGSNNIELLEIYLNCDRNITNTAKEMFLHRNSVIYRIGKIESMLGVSLDDPTVKFDLLVSLRCLKLARDKIDTAQRTNDQKS